MRVLTRVGSFAGVDVRQDHAAEYAFPQEGFRALRGRRKQRYLRRTQSLASSCALPVSAAAAELLMSVTEGRVVQNRTYWNKIADDVSTADHRID